MSKATHRTFDYSVAVAMILLVMLLKEVTDRLFGGGPPLILFLIAVMFTSRFCGAGPGLLATALSAPVCMYFYFPPTRSFQVHSTNDAFRLVVFLLEGVALCALMGSLHAARRRVEQSMRDAIRQEQALREGEKRFHLLVESVEDYAIIMLDPNGLVASWNVGAERIKGYKADEIVGQHFSCFYPSEDIESGKLERVLQMAASGQRFSGEGWRVRKDGSRFWASVVITAVRDDAGQLRGFSKVTRDITERKRYEEQLHRTYDELAIARDQALEASCAKSEFLANMSHEIRTPLNGILGLTELILDSELSREHRESMDMLKSSAESLLTVINDILDFSKIEAGKLELDPIEFALRDLLEDTLKSMALRAAHKGLELACDIGADVPEQVVGDPGRLRQVLINLVGNAIKFTEHGEVTIRAELVPPFSGEHDVRFVVSDTGIGIPPEKQQSIFEAFSQADGSTTRKYGGTGLGLTISSQLVALMGGQLRVESIAGQGSSFHFVARFGKPDPAAAPSIRRPPTNLYNLAVLVVDDSATNRRILEATLRRWGARPTVVESGPAALAELRRATVANEPFPLLLVDAMMPNMDGFSLINQIRAEPALERPIIMMLSSADSLGDAERCRKLGVAAYLVKPVKSDELQDAIVSLLRGGPDSDLLSHSLTRRFNLAPAIPLGIGQSVRILLAEDNPVNQRVALRILAKHGFEAHVVSNGREAVAAVSQQQFDLVLMDVQMPEMDGFEATRAIRLEEAASGRHIPIIAMTAHAMKGDRERCLGAGMDDYVTKPIQTTELLRAIQSLSPAPSLVVESPIAKDTPSCTFDRQSALDQVEGDEVFLAEIARLFLANLPGQLQEIRDAIAHLDGPRLYRAAHALKGAVGYLAASPASAAAQQLEEMGQNGKLDAAPTALVSLESETNRLTAAIQELITQPSA